MSSTGNGNLRRWASRAAVTTACVVIFTWLAPKVIAIGHHVELVQWAEQHRKEYPVVMEGYRGFQQSTERGFREVNANSNELKDVVKALTVQVTETNKQVTAVIAVSAANQDMLYQLLAIKRREMGLPPLSRPTTPSP